MSGKVRIAWSAPPAAMAARADTWWTRVETNLVSEMQNAGELVRAYAVSSHPWQNRTGAAEAGLTVTVTFNGSEIELSLAHGVDYGRWLETRWGGRWGVIPQAISVGIPLVTQAAINAMRG